MSIELIQSAIVKQLEEVHDPVLHQVLSQVLTFLTKSKNGADDDYLKQALTYLGAMPVNRGGFATDLLTKVGLFETKKPVPLISSIEDNQPTEAVFDDELHHEMRLTQSLYKPPHQALSAEAKDILKNVYSAIRKEYEEPVWVYDYAPSAFQEYLSSGWDIELDQALGDFKRDVEINGIRGAVGGEKSEITVQRVEAFVANAVAYSDKEKDRLARWIRNNGGQAMMGFATNVMFEKPQFSADGISSVSAQNHMDWTIEKNQIGVNFVMVVGSVQFKDEKYLVAGKPAPGEYSDEVERQNILKAQGKPVPKLMVFKGRMDLRIVPVDGEETVQPVMSSCRVTSYTDQLRPPAPQFSLKEQRNNKPTLT